MLGTGFDATGGKRNVIQAVKHHATLPAGVKCIAVVSDTHSAPHPGTLKALGELKPDAIFHAGDIGDLAVLQPLRDIAPLYVIRGNIDERGSSPRGSAAEGQRGVVDTRADELPDTLVIDHESGLRTLMVHIGVYGPKLRAEVGKLARAEKASFVVCGHSHVPFIGVDRGIHIFNPGSCGPRRMTLPIVMGRIDFTPTGIKLAHINCETGAPWAPP